MAGVFPSPVVSLQHLYMAGQLYRVPQLIGCDNQLHIRTVVYGKIFHTTHFHLFRIISFPGKFSIPAVSMAGQMIVSHKDNPLRI